MNVDYLAKMMSERDAERDIDRRLPEDIALSLQSQIQDATLLVGPGQYSPHAHHARVMILRVDRQGEEPSVVWDRFFHRESISRLKEALYSYAKIVWLGEFDTMYGTPWSHAWTTPPEILRVYGRQGCIVQIESDKIHINRGDTRVILSVSEVAHVAGWLSPDWYKREVWIVKRNGEHIVVGEAEEAMAHLDPTYDGLDLMCDAAWVKQLGEAIAAGIGVSYTSDDSTLA